MDQSGNGYPFSWLDELVEIRLNPEKNDVNQITVSETRTIRERLPAEMAAIGRQLKLQSFSLYRNRYVKAVAGHYDTSIRLLNQQMRINISQYPRDGHLYETGELVIAHLNELYESIRQRYTSYLAASSSTETVQNSKVRCGLSVDQIGILLKAADSMHLIIARSFSELLRSIVPYLSTERFKEISWKSARSSTYKMEQNDKEVVLRVLEELAGRIKDF
ncbi:hypothetical protein ACFQZI_00040 [Mucilaginibacter lutimaris]|uniref:Uncharacterized protein n=1 Tax=Mucilaginibacter lutimaris TaxID=931629 RepID=A0ABW2Z8X7_9SPHI